MSDLAKNFSGRVVPKERFPELATLLARITETCDPIDIILYGSRARGDATDQSDWDLKVVVPDETADKFFSPMFGWRLQEGSGVYADVSCVRISDFRADLNVPNSAASHIVDDGVVLDVR